VEAEARSHVEAKLTSQTEAMVEAMKARNMPVSQSVKCSFVEVSERKRLVCRTVADFIPGVAPYEIRTTVEFRQEGKRVRMVVTEDAMHDAMWTELSTMGLNQQFDRLGKALSPI
jgi:hypothetical protein